MNVNVYEGKEYDKVLSEALSELNVKENEVLIFKEEIKGKLFKSSSVKIKIIKYIDIAEYCQKKLTEILSSMDIDVSFESKIRDNQIYLKMYSSKNPILIGKNGQTLEALQNILKSIVHKEINIFPMLILDVENYKEKQEKRLERLAKNVAREVIRSKIPAKLESMNSYQRRIIHNTLTDFKGVVTASEGEEPNRYIVISPEK